MSSSLLSMKFLQLVQDEVLAKVCTYVKGKTGVEFTVEELSKCCEIPSYGSSNTKLILPTSKETSETKDKTKRIAKITQDEMCIYMVGGKNPHRCGSKAVNHGYCNSCLKKTGVRNELQAKGILLDGSPVTKTKAAPGGFAPGTDKIPTTGLSQGIPDLRQNNDIIRDGDKMLDKKRGFVLRSTGQHGKYYCEGKKVGNEIVELTPEEQKQAAVAGYTVISKTIPVPSALGQSLNHDALGVDDTEDQEGSDLEIEDDDEEY